MNNYFILDEGNQQKGPISPEQFGAYGVTPNTMVWCNGMATWKRASDVPELQPYLNTATTAGPDLPPPAPVNDANNNTAYSQPAAPSNNMGYNPNGNQGYNQGYASQNNQGYNQGGYAPQGNQGGYQQGVCPDNNMVWAILSTIFCCVPLGIVSIVYASKVKGLYYQGDTAGAIDAAQKARNWAIGGAVSGLVVSFIYGICVFAAAL